MQNKKNIPILVSVSGGRTSATMAKYLKDKYQGKRKMIFVFANTGKERIETLEFVNEIDKRWQLNIVWIEAVPNKTLGIGTTYKIVDFESSDKEGKVFESIIEKYGIPNQAFPHCTRELKMNPIHKYAKDVLGNDYETAIGIRIDESHRINWQQAKEKNYIYPLATEVKATSESIRSWWAKQDFDLKLNDYQGNCDLCWKKSQRKLLTIINENPTLLNWWVDMEVKYGSENKYSFFRSNKTGIDLLELSKGNFQKAVDRWEQSQTEPTLFSHPELDVDLDCFCKST
jgi:3'-phosphoadenosine 5'-phosphosulfate sulfotransferase (PAPS reductase)/FAD synthetase